tara:strand:- start:826 stop:1509 length:684 start_codon:yes stop_codon:yes gene_type:complete
MAMAEEGGEGGEGASSADAISSDAVYLAQLSFIRGHLYVGVSLYREGDLEAAATHMKHPGDELYAALLPAIESRDGKGFGEQLEGLADAVIERRLAADVEAAYTALLLAIGEAESAVQDLNARTLGEVIVDLVRTAAAEYDIAVDDEGILVEPHEYQDSLGFVHTAREKFALLETMSDSAAALMAIETQLEVLLPIWPSLQAPEKLSTAPSVIYGAASRIEIATTQL